VADRYAILAEVVVGQVTITVVAVHLSFAIPNALAQLRRLGGYVPSHRPSVVAGDCNLWGPLATRTLGDHRRAVRGRTWPAARPHSQLDHILVSPTIAVERSRVLPPAGSDHLPVQARLSIR
jgi:endonuclease/exonuclease/phosphatase family metal-dependent hydrolase